MQDFLPTKVWRNLTEISVYMDLWLLQTNASSHKKYGIELIKVITEMPKIRVTENKSQWDFFFPKEIKFLEKERENVVFLQNADFFFSD